MPSKEKKDPVNNVDGAPTTIEPCSAKETTKETATSSNDVTTIPIPATTTTNDEDVAPRGKPVSGRDWKGVQTKRHSSIVKRPRNNLHSGWHVLQQQRTKMNLIKQHQKELKDAVFQERMAKIQREKERRLYKEEMEKRAEVVQSVN